MALKGNKKLREEKMVNNVRKSSTNQDVEDEIKLQSQLLNSLQEKVAEMEEKLEESAKKNEELEQKLEEEIQIAEELREEIKEKDEILEDFSNRIKQYESVDPSITMSRKSSVSYKPPCECLNTGFDHCVLYPKEFCKCSASCTFVNEYLQGGQNDETEVISMRTYSRLITPEPGSEEDMLDKESKLHIIEEKGPISLSPPPPGASAKRSTPSPTSSSSSTSSSRIAKDTSRKNSGSDKKQKINRKGAVSKPLNSNKVVTEENTTNNTTDPLMEEE